MSVRRCRRRVDVVVARSSTRQGHVRIGRTSGQSLFGKLQLRAATAACGLLCGTWYVFFCTATHQNMEQNSKCDDARYHNTVEGLPKEGYSAHKEEHEGKESGGFNRTHKRTRHHADKHITFLASCPGWSRGHLLALVASTRVMEYGVRGWSARGEIGNDSTNVSSHRRSRRVCPRD